MQRQGRRGGRRQRRRGDKDHTKTRKASRRSGRLKIEYLHVFARFAQRTHDNATKQRRPLEPTTPLQFRCWPTAPAVCSSARSCRSCRVSPLDACRPVVWQQLAGAGWRYTRGRSRAPPVLVARDARAAAQARLPWNYAPTETLAWSCQQAQQPGWERAHHIHSSKR